MTIRPMRGQCVVRELKPTDSPLWTPKEDPYSVKTHRGVVLGIGAPALNCATDKMGRCASLTCGHVEVPWGFEVGATVQFHMGHHQDAHTRVWSDGLMALWVPQFSIDGVIE